MKKKIITILIAWQTIIPIKVLKLNMQINFHTFLTLRHWYVSSRGSLRVRPVYKQSPCPMIVVPSIKQNKTRIHPYVNWNISINKSLAGSPKDSQPLYVNSTRNGNEKFAKPYWVTKKKKNVYDNDINFEVCKFENNVIFDRMSFRLLLLPRASTAIDLRAWVKNKLW